ncbi:hypothetical protein THAR02_04304 [Trichoderma harzianum]|uniref:Peptidase metallopeptidase domain-containing protein n=1 Tax=Trichoderma harzianum TaxID=5544 RepID=A0A0F9XGE4_TRIHA|nr:hypothetical protein THAR02_04304 [Trichoderma harzianum]
MSTTPIHHENGNVGQHSCRPYMEALEPMSTFNCRTLSVHSDTTRYCDPESQLENGLDPDLSTNAETGATTAAAFICRTADPLYTAEPKYRCATETYGCTEVRVGKGDFKEDYIPRWRRGSELTYTIDAKSFPTSAEAVQVKAAMQTAINMWKGIGASFKYLEVDNSDSATFVVTYHCHGPRNIYASSFFPDESPGDLLVYRLGLFNAVYLANILAHEIGHILGLRHEFADKTHKEGKILRCVLFGKENPRSIMNYYKNPGELQVSQQDLRELKEFYECSEESYDGLPIYDYDPISRKRVSREETRYSHAMRKSGRKFSYRSALRKLDSFIFTTFHDVKRATV